METDYQQRIVSIARGHIGYSARRYELNRPGLGVDPETGFDCSGFVVFVLNEAGLVVPSFVGADTEIRPIRHASELFDHYGVAVHDDRRRAGDLAFFSRNGHFPTHVGILTSAETIVHSPGKDSSVVIEEALVFDAIKTATTEPILYTQNPIGFKRPTIALEDSSYRYHQSPI